MVITKILQKASEDATFSENIYYIDRFSLNALYCLFLSDHLVKAIFYEKKNKSDWDNFFHYSHS